MKIIVIGTRGIPSIQGGVETHCEELFPVMKQYHPKDQITIVRRSAYVTPETNFAEYNGIHIKTLYSPKNKSFEAIVHTLMAVFYAAIKRPDLLHIHAVGPNLVTPLARLFGLKVVMTHHGPDYERQKWGTLAKWFLRTGEWCGVRFANKVIVISEGIGMHIANRYGKRDYIVIPNGVPTAIINEEIDYLKELGLEQKKYIFTLGRFVPEKGFDYLIKAYKQSGIDTEYKLVISGDADHESEYSLNLKKQARANNIILTGFIKGKRLQQLYTHARLFVLPSFYEGLPISLLEAMSYNLDILAGDIIPNKEVKIDSDSYFSTGDINDLALKLKNKLMLSNDDMIKYNISRYNWENIAMDTYKVYLSV